MHKETLISWTIHQKQAKHPQIQSPRGAHKYSMMRQEDKRQIEVILHKYELWFDNEGTLAFLYEATLAL